MVKNELYIINLALEELYLVVPRRRISNLTLLSQSPKQKRPNLTFGKTLEPVGRKRRLLTPFSMVNCGLILRSKIVGSKKA